ncbi:MAG: SoxR reducing system RseC family protein [Bacteroidota bacterium]|nr:SoxR reducing system RseC family protein [Bacteroidota bacterium]
MPESRNRQKHHQHVHHQTGPHTQQSSPKNKRTAASVVAIIAGILGLAVAYFTQGADVFWLIAGTLIGVLLGYIVGRSMDRSIAKK